MANKPGKSGGGARKIGRDKDTERHPCRHAYRHDHLQRGAKATKRPGQGGLWTKHPSNPDLNVPGLDHMRHGDLEHGEMAYAFDLNRRSRIMACELRSARMMVAEYQGKDQEHRAELAAMKEAGR